LEVFLIPIPPLNEQQRIVDKIEYLTPYINKYEQVENELFELDSTIKEKLKKSILQYAIQGKLVKQNPNDEPASVLLEHIKVEKEQLIKEGKIK
jgi:Type I restriction modification DNA specificity domain.